MARVILVFDDVEGVPGAVKIQSEPDMEALIPAVTAGLGLTPAQGYALYCLRHIEERAKSGVPIHVHVNSVKKIITPSGTPH